MATEAVEEVAEVAEELFAKQAPKLKTWGYDLNVEILSMRLAFTHALIAMIVFFGSRAIPNLIVQRIIAGLFPATYFSCIGWFVLIFWAEWHKRGLSGGKTVAHGVLNFIKEGSEESSSSVERSLVISKVEKIEPRQIVETIVNTMLPEVRTAVQESELLDLVVEAMNKMLPPCKERIVTEKGKVEYRPSRYVLNRWSFPTTPVEDPFNPGTVFSSCLVIQHPQFPLPELAFDKSTNVRTHFGYYESRMDAYRMQLDFYRWFVPTGEYIGTIGLPRAIRYTLEQAQVTESILKFFETTSLMQQQQTLTSAILDKFGEKAKTQKLLRSKLRLGAGMDSSQSVLGGPSTTSTFVKEHGRGLLGLGLVIIVVAALLVLIWLGFIRLTRGAEIVGLLEVLLSL